MDYFQEAVTKTLQWEGGYSNDPNDPGGPTKYGISKKAFPRLDIKAITLAQAKGIYKHRYWDACNLDLIAKCPVSAKVFDLAVNCGAVRASTWLQQACNLLGATLKEDGNIGHVTAEWVNRYAHQEALLCAVKGLAFNHYLRQDKPRFLAGWLNRLEA